MAPTIGSPEDQRSAANIYASLSSYVMTASLGVIAAQAALATFVLDRRDHLTGFYICLVSGLLASVASIVMGGKGVADIASAGFDGAWTLKPKGDLFNYQAPLCLVGMALLLFSLFTGSPKVENQPPTLEIQLLNDRVQKLQVEIDSLRTQVLKGSEEMNASPVREPQRRSAPSRRAHK